MKNWTKNSPYRNKDKDEIADIFYEQFKKHGVRLPETYTEQELIDLNPVSYTHLTLPTNREV